MSNCFYKIPNNKKPARKSFALSDAGGQISNKLQIRNIKNKKFES